MYRFAVPWYCELCYTTASQKKTESRALEVSVTETPRVSYHDTPTGYTVDRRATLYTAVVYVVVPSSLSLHGVYRDPWIMPKVMVLGLPRIVTCTNHENTLMDVGRAISRVADEK